MKQRRTRAGAYPTVSINLWSEDAIVLLSWLNEVDLDEVPAGHKVEQALTDLGTQLDGIVPYDYPLTDQRVAEAQLEVSKEMNW